MRQVPNTVATRLSAAIKRFQPVIPSAKSKASNRSWDSETHFASISPTGT